MYCRIHTHLNTIFHEQVWREYVFKKLREGFSLKRSHMLVIEVCLLEVSVSVWLLIYIVMTCSCSTPWGFVVLCGVSHFHNRSSSGHHQRGVGPRGTWCISICRDLGSPNKTGGTLCTWVSRSVTLSPEEENIDWIRGFTHLVSSGNLLRMIGVRLMSDLNINKNTC